MREIPQNYHDLIGRLPEAQGLLPGNKRYLAEENSILLEILEADTETKFWSLLAACDYVARGALNQNPEGAGNLNQPWLFSTFIKSVLKCLIEDLEDNPSALDESELRELLENLLKIERSYGYLYLTTFLVALLQTQSWDAEKTARWKAEIGELRQAFSAIFSPTYQSCEPHARFLAEIWGQKHDGFLEGGDAFADAVISDFEAMDEGTRALWLSLFDFARSANGSKPTEKWLKAAQKQLYLVGETEFQKRVETWFALFGKDDGWWFADREHNNDTFFKGLVWLSSLLDSPVVVCAQGAALRGALKARGRAGVRSQRVANALIWALSRRDETEAATHLINAKTRVKNGAILKTLDRAIEAVATRARMSGEDLEELAVPDFGLQNGVVSRDFGAATVKIELAGGKAVWRWQSDGKAVKAVPASVKRNFAEELKELKTQIGELEKTFAAQKERLDSLLRTQKTWDFTTWKTRYLEHPLMQLLAARVIWKFDEVAAMPRENGFLNARGETVSVPQTARVSLWHPIFDCAENVLAWRRFLEENAISQPFKQAHREVYLLTDAERATRTYSNRFAAHILKQHQFNSLCAARGWKNSLRLMVDDEYPPATKLWPQFGLRAEFWIEGIGEDYGVDTNETGTFLRVSTDQVRFYALEAGQNSAHAGGGGYRIGWRQAPAEPLLLEEIAPLVFSETMRDVDLFVGVASLGADEAWRDGGPDGHFRDYWHDYSFGELGESAKSRADVLERLLPRLKIRDVARVEGRFLRIEGKKRAYKIHLGSGNILMEPNDQYLCIVPKSGGDELFLPFEGDKTLAVILSKAFLLSEDDKIKDASILSQIGGE